MFIGNEGYINICNSCLNHFEKEYTAYFNDNDRACVRLCEIFNWYVNESVLGASRKINEEQSRISAIVSKGQIIPHTGKTYDDRILEKSKSTIASLDKYEELKEQGLIKVSQTTIDRWGIGIFEDSDYGVLDEHYKMLKKQNPNCDNNQEIFIKDLCYIKLQQIAAIRDKNTDSFDKLTKLYRDTFKQAGLKTIVESDLSNDEAFGVTLATISQFTPEEYYKDKKLYKDFDGLLDGYLSVCSYYR